MGAFFTSGTLEGIEAVTIDPGKAHEGFPHLLSPHTLDRITPDAINSANSRHICNAFLQLRGSARYFWWRPETRYKVWRFWFEIGSPTTTFKLECPLGVKNLRPQVAPATSEPEGKPDVTDAFPDLRAPMSGAEGIAVEL